MVPKLKQWRSYICQTNTAEFDSLQSVDASKTVARTSGPAPFPFDEKVRGVTIDGSAFSRQTLSLTEAVIAARPIGTANSSAGQLQPLVKN